MSKTAGLSSYVGKPKVTWCLDEAFVLIKQTNPAHAVWRTLPTPLPLPGLCPLPPPLTPALCWLHSNCWPSRRSWITRSRSWSRRRRSSLTHKRCWKCSRNKWVSQLLPCSPNQSRHCKPGLSHMQTRAQGNLQETNPVLPPGIHNAIPNHSVLTPLQSPLMIQAHPSYVIVSSRRQMGFDTMLNYWQWSHVSREAACFSPV